MDLFSKYACVYVIYFVPVLTSTYRMGKKRLKIALDHNIKSARVVVNLALYQNTHEGNKRRSLLGTFYIYSSFNLRCRIKASSVRDIHEAAATSSA